MKSIKLFEDFSNEAENRDTLAELNEMALGQLERIADYADMIKDRMTKGEQLESWMYSQLTVSLENLNSVHDAMDGNDGVVERKRVVEKKSDYQVYHNLYSSAIDTALEYAEGQGYTYDKEETAVTIGMGDKKPKDGVTNKFTITLYKDGKEQKKALQIQVYGMGNKYELNTYIA